MAILRGPRRETAAFAISALTSPFLVCAVAAGALAAWVASSWREIVLWATFTSVLAGVVPFLVVLLMYRRGRVSDLHVAERERRWIPFGASILSGVLGLVVLWLADAPAELHALAVAYLANAIIFAGVSLWWKASVHAAVFVAALTACALVVAPWWWAGMAGVPLVIWARSQRGRHTVAQGIVGALIALLATAATYQIALAHWTG